MPQQGVIDWTTLANRARLAECGLTPNEIEMVLLVIRKGEPYTAGDDRRWVLRMSNRQMARELGISNSTVRAVARRLATRTTADGLSAFSDRDFDAAGVYRVSQNRINGLAFARAGPVQDRDGLDRPPGRAVGGATHNHLEILRSNQGPTPNQNHINRYRFLAAHPDPWSELTDEDLRFATAELLDALYESACDHRWCQRTEGDRRLFFGLALHAQTTRFKSPAPPGKQHNRRIRVLVGNLKHKRHDRLTVGIKRRAADMLLELAEGEKSTGSSSLSREPSDD